MSELLASGNTKLRSADFTVAAGGVAALFIKPGSLSEPPPAGVDFYLQHKTSGGNYSTVLVLNAANIADKGLIVAPGTYAVERQASGAISAGMDIQQ